MLSPFGPAAAASPVQKKVPVVTVIVVVVVVVTVIIVVIVVVWGNKGKQQYPFSSAFPHPDHPTYYYVLRGN